MLKDKFGFNFWPSFTDLMLSLVLVVLIILFVVSKMIAAGSENLDKARESQQQIQTQITENISDKYKVAIISGKDGHNVTEEIKHNTADIYIIDKLDRQTITFSDKVLFDSGQSYIKTAGYDILNIVGPIIAKNLDNIGEIQIQGHADIDYEDDFNLNLAAARAISVYKFLQINVGIDPAKYLMSATSFGKYKAVGREAGSDYNLAELYSANATDELKARNRRIEIVLYYKNTMKN
jgi:outer membrane protein OmpA-like peptidoglycan-associated protein